jgi:hypothetical protein
VEKILSEFKRMVGESEALRNELPQLRLADEDWPARLAKHEASEPNIVVRRSSAAVA